MHRNMTPVRNTSASYATPEIYTLKINDLRQIDS